MVQNSTTRTREKVEQKWTKKYISIKIKKSYNTKYFGVMAKLKTRQRHHLAVRLTVLVLGLLRKNLEV